MLALSDRVNAPRSMFSATVRLGKMPRPSGAMTSPCRTSSCAGLREMSWPWYSTRPERGRSRPQMVLSVVVLPAPLQPMRVTTSPAWT
ncbi:MAG: hypothetical protein HPKKFMNG_03165 [Planctomycetes bacterium]|nr:hypothetical protein [Planctomycetota bacterium]